MFTTARLTACLLCTGLLFAACKKESDDPATFPNLPPPAAPVITSFSITDYCKRKVTINGRGFNTSISKDSIFFGGIRGEIDSVTSTTIVATYPTFNVSGSIKVYINGVSATSITTWFAIGPPVITSFSPTTAGPGTIVTITGGDFGDSILTDSVFFGNTRAEIVSVTPTQITVKTPQNASGQVTVHSHCQSVTSVSQFSYSNKGMVYVSGNSGYCYAIDIASGALVWKVYVQSLALAGPTYDNGVVYIGSTDVNILDNNYMYALDATTGAQIWKSHAGPWDCIPAIHEGVVYAGGFDKNFYAFNASTGDKLWSYTAGDYFRAGGPTYYNGNVYTRNDDSYFYCLDASTGNMKWRLPIWPGGNPTAANGIVYTVGSGIFMALDAETGETKWSLPMQYQSGNSPTVVNDKVYVASENHQIYCLDAVSGTIIWQIEASWWVASAMIVVDNILYVSNGDGVVGGVNATTGTILWAKALPPSDLVGMSPVVANDMLFVGDGEGTFHALNAKTGVDIWSFSTGGYPIISSACVVDAQGVVYHAGDSGNQQ